MEIFKTVVNNNSIYRRYVEVIDTLTKLTEREKDIFSILLMIQHKWIGDRYNILNRVSRKQVLANTYVHKSNLSKYLKRLRNKEVIVYGEWGTEISPYLFPDFDDPDFIVTYKFIRNEEQ